MSMIFYGLSLVLQAFQIIIVVWALLSWLPGGQQSGFGQALGRLADLVVGPIRRILPTVGMLDFSPLVAILLLQGAQYGLASIARTVLYG